VQVPTHIRSCFANANANRPALPAQTGALALARLVLAADGLGTKRPFGKRSTLSPHGVHRKLDIGKLFERRHDRRPLIIPKKIEQFRIGNIRRWPL
jgi:hypothetical protein